MHPIIKTFVALRIMFYCTLTEKKWLHYQVHETKKGIQFTLCEYKMELGKAYSQIVLLFMH